MVVDFLVTVLLPTTRNEQHNSGLFLRLRIIANRPAQCSGQCCAVPFVSEGHFFCRVGIRWLRMLRTLQFFQALRQHKGSREAHLRESTVELAILQPGAISNAQGFYLHSQRVVRQTFLLGGNALCTLVGTVHCDLHVTVGLLQIKYYCQSHRTYIQFARP